MITPSSWESISLSSSQLRASPRGLEAFDSGLHQHTGHHLLGIREEVLAVGQVTSLREDELRPERRGIGHLRGRRDARHRGVRDRLQLRHLDEQHQLEVGVALRRLARSEGDGREPDFDAASAVLPLDDRSPRDVSVPGIRAKGMGDRGRLAISDGQVSTNSH
jgi:hypothetical protein